MLNNLKLTNVEIMSMIDVGGPRLNRIRQSMKGVEIVKPVRTVPHATANNDIERILKHITSNVLDVGYPCQHNRLQLFVVGKHQGSTWSKLWTEYRSQCQQEKVRVMSYNSYREIVQHNLPSNSTRTTLTNVTNVS